jgi:ankyrin repeat protein
MSQWQGRRFGWLMAGVFMTASAAAAPPDTRLVDAMARQDAQAARALLKQGADVNAHSADGTTAVHWAAHWNDVETLGLLLKAGADVNAADDHGVTALSLASENVGVQMVDVLLKAGANPNLARTSGMTPLFDAIEVGSIDIVKMLMARGANVNATTTKTKITPLMWAVSETRTEIVQMLLAAHADVQAVTTDGFSALTFAARAGSIEIAKLLIAAGLPVNETGPNRVHALPYAALSGQDAFAMFLLDQGADPNATLSGVTALHAASGNATQFLADWERARSGGVGLGGGAFNLFGPGGVGRRGANTERRLPLVQALLQKGARVNETVKSSAMAQSYIGRPTKGAFEPFSCGTGDFRNATPLWLASFAANQSGPMGAFGADNAPPEGAAEAMPDRYPSVEIMRALLDAGADFTLTSDDGTTPLMVAAGLGRCTFNPNIKRGARSPSAEAAVTMLLDKGADINAVNEADFTALHGAAMRGLNEVIKILVDRGAKINARDFRGRTPYRLAEGSKQSFQFQAYAETAEFIKSLGANTRLGVPGTVQERMRDIPAAGQHQQQRQQQQN